MSTHMHEKGGLHSNPLEGPASCRHEKVITFSTQPGEPTQAQ